MPPQVPRRGQQALAVGRAEVDGPAVPRGADLRVRALDLAIEDGKIVELSAGLSGSAKEEIDAEGLHLRTTLTIPPPRALLAALVRGARRVARAIAWSAWPLTTPAGLGVAVAVAAAALHRAPRAVREALLLPQVALLAAVAGTPAPARNSAAEGALLAAAAAAAVMATVMAIAWLSRLALLLLLRDRSFLRLRVGAPVPLRQRLWHAAVRALTSGSPLLFQFERSLPRLPLPPLEATVARYLASQEPLAAPEERARLAALGAAFLRGEGPALQRRLRLKALFTRNYVSDWWEQFVYLRGRDPIAVGSNYYALDSGRQRISSVQTARAAVLISQLIEYCVLLEDEAVAPVLLGGGGAGAGGVPLSMSQCRRVFATTRIPGRECDRVRHWDVAGVRHVAVYCEGTMYLLDVFDEDGSTPRAPDELEDALADIVYDAHARVAAAGAAAKRGGRAAPGMLREAEACLPALTAARRADWAETRETLFGDGANKRALNAVEKASPGAARASAARAGAAPAIRAATVLTYSRTAPSVRCALRRSSMLCSTRAHPRCWTGARARALASSASTLACGPASGSTSLSP